MTIRHRQTVLVSMTLLAVGTVGVWLSFRHFTAQRAQAQAATATHASVLAKARQLTRRSSIAEPTHTTSAAGVMSALVQTMRAANIDPAQLTAHDVGEARSIQGIEAKRRLVTLTFDDMEPGELAMLLSAWQDDRPSLRSVQLTHQTREDVNTFQIRLVLELLEPATTLTEPVS